jgi:hypothetical protein
MATKKPRITVTLEPHVYEVLTKLAGLQGGSRSSIISDLMQSVTPIFERTCYVLQLAETANSGMNDDIKASMERSEAKLQEMMADAMGQLDVFSMDIIRASKDGSDGAGGPCAAGDMGTAEDGPLPPHSNTGVTPKPHRKTPKKTATWRNP